MAESKRGRPKKQPIEKPVENEEAKIVNMSTEEVTLEKIQNRWAGIFGRYAHQGFDTISSAWSMAWSQLNNPFVQNYRIKQTVPTPIKAQQEDLQKALANPENGEMLLSQASMWLYYTNYVYNILVKLNRDTPMFNYYYTPLYVDAKEVKSENFRRESKKVDKILKSFKPELTLKTITTQVSLEGKSSYLPRLSYDKENVNFFVMQKLNSNMVKLTGFASKQQFKASFNMMIFLQPAYDVSQYPPFIQKTWEKMTGSGLVVKDKKGNAKVNPKASVLNWGELNGVLESGVKGGSTYYMYWVELPQDLCYTFYTDGAHSNAFPDTIGLFNDLNELDDYRWLQASLLSKGVNSVLTASVPIVKDAKSGSDATVITPDTILGYQDYFSNNVSNNILPFLGPFTDYKLHTMASQPEALDIIFDRTRDLIATSGNSALMSITDKPSIASVKASQAIQAARMDYLTKQYESFLNEVINNSFDLKYTWKISVWSDIFNIREDQKNLKEAVVNGLEGLLPKLLSSYGYTVEDYLASKNYMNGLGIRLEKVQQVLDAKAKLREENKEEANGEVDKGVGRPTKGDTEIENDSTAASHDQGTDVSEIKEFVEELVNIL